MSTNIRAELSQSNPYWVERHRYYELKHFCLQYPMWKRAYALIDGLQSAQTGEDGCVRSGEVADPTPKIAEVLAYYSDRIRMVEETAKKASPDLGIYILKGVTQAMTYEQLNARIRVPCCRDVYYETYRRFFWLLDKARK